MSTGKFQSLLNRTLKVFQAEESPKDTREATHTSESAEREVSPQERLSQQVSSLANLLNVNADEVSIQHRSRKGRGTSTLFLVAIQEEDCTLELAFSSDLLQVFLSRLKTTSSISPSRLYTLLTARGLVCDSEQLESVFAAGVITQKGKIVQGVAPLPGRDEQIHFPFFSLLEVTE